MRGIGRLTATLWADKGTCVEWRAQHDSLPAQAEGPALAALVYDPSSGAGAHYSSFVRVSFGTRAPDARWRCRIPSRMIRLMGMSLQSCGASAYPYRTPKTGRRLSWGSYSPDGMCRNSTHAYATLTEYSLRSTRNSQSDRNAAVQASTPCGGGPCHRNAVSVAPPASATTNQPTAFS